MEGKERKHGGMKGYPSEGVRKDVRKADKDKDRKRDGKVTKKRMYEIEG